MSQDFPFSVNSKYTIEAESFGTITTAEHLVSVRAANAADMARRLDEARNLFPFAIFVTAGQATVEDLPVADLPELPATTPIRPDGNGNGHRSQHAAAVAQATQNGHRRAAQARVDRKAALPHLCPEHGIAHPSKKVPRGYYCPTRLEDGSYCKWHWQEPADTFVHPRDEN